MDEETVGKGISNNKLRIIAAILVCGLLMSAFPASAATPSSNRELELFEKGYENYFSYRPEMAVEAFRAFLKEFPDSSARDAVLYWYGKALLQVKSYEDAGKVFSELKKEFPDSPFVRHLDKEIGAAKRGAVERPEGIETRKGKEVSGGQDERERLALEVESLKRSLDEAVKGKSVLEAKLAEAEKRAEGGEKERKGALDEAGRLKKVLEEEKKSTEAMRLQAARGEGKESESKALVVKIEEQDKNLKEKDNSLKQAQEEKGRLDAEIKRLQTSIDASAKDKRMLEAKLAESENKVELREKDLTKTGEERDRLKVLLQEEQKKTEDAGRRAETSEARDAELKSLRDVAKEKKELEARLAEAEKQVTAKEKERVSAQDEAGRLKKALEEEKKSTDAPKLQTARGEDKESETKALLAKVEEQQKGLRESEQSLKQAKEEKGRLDAEIKRLQTSIDASAKDKRMLEAKLAESERKADFKGKDVAAITEERNRLRLQLEEEKRKEEEVRGKMTKLLKVLTDTVAEKNAHDEKLAAAERDLAKTVEERDRLKASLQEEKRKAGDAGARGAGSEAKEAELKGLREAMKEKKGLEAKLAEAEKQVEAKEKERALASEEAGRLKKALEEEKKSAEALKLRAARGEGKGDEGKELALAAAEKEKMKSLLEEEGKRTEELKARVVQLEKREKELMTFSETVKNLSEARLSEIGKKTQTTERELAKAIEEREKLKVLADEEKKRADRAEAGVKGLEARENEIKSLQAKVEEQQRKMGEAEKESGQLRQGKKQADTEIETLKREKAEIEKKWEGLEKKYTEAAVRVQGKAFSAVQVYDFMTRSSAALSKAGIDEVPWRTGNVTEDFVNEQLLLNEARRSGAAVDSKRQGELAERYKLNQEESEYLQGYLMISQLVRKKMKEKRVEMLVVKFTSKDKLEKALFAAELQGYARSGKSLEEISRENPGVIFRVETKRLQGWVEERTRGLKPGEVSDVIWTEEGYVILKPSFSSSALDSLENADPETKDKIRRYVKTWAKEISAEQAR